VIGTELSKIWASDEASELKMSGMSSLIIAPLRKKS